MKQIVAAFLLGILCAAAHELIALLKRPEVGEAFGKLAFAVAEAGIKPG